MDPRGRRGACDTTGASDTEPSGRSRRQEGRTTTKDSPGGPTMHTQTQEVARGECSWCGGPVAVCHDSGQAAPKTDHADATDCFCSLMNHYRGLPDPEVLY